MDKKFPWRGVCCKQQQTGRADGFFFYLVPLDSSVHTTAASRVNVKNLLSTRRPQYDRSQG